MSNSPNFNEGSDQESLYKNKYSTDFMRVPHTHDDDPIRHPGAPTSTPLASRKQSGTRQWSPQDHSRVAFPPLSYGSSSSAQGTMPEDVMCCPVCKIDYDTVLKRPILLPGCGHTLCSVCVRERSMTTLECPTCRRSYPGASVDSLPVNISLEALLVNKYGQTTLQRIIKENSGEGKTSANCRSHGIRLSFWCRTCEEVACGECLFDKHPSDGHDLAKLQDVASEIRDTAVSTISICHDDAAKLFSGHLKDFVALLGQLHEAGKLMQDSRKLVAAAECAKDFASVTSVYEAIKKINGEVVKLKLEKIGEKEDAAEEAKQDSEENKELEEKVAVTSHDEAGKVKAVPVAPSESCQVFAMHSDGRLARVETEEHGLHIYSLAQYATTGYSVAVRLGLLMEFIQGENPIVFLDFNLKEEKLGRVYLKLRGDMRRSLQFLHLCLGTMGPTYRGSRVDGISEPGAPGEYLRMGDYTGQGGQGGVGLLDGLEWGSNWSAPKQFGQVCGVGGDAGEKRFGALFAICIRDNPNDQFRCPFGSVFRGMPILYNIAKMASVDSVYISECGALIPIE